MYKLEEVQEFLDNVLDSGRVEELYRMISNPHLRVNSKDKKWVAYVTQASEDQTVVDAIKEILTKHQIAWQMIKDDAIKAINKTGNMFVESDIKMKPRIPFYVLVLNQIIK